MCSICECVCVLFSAYGTVRAAKVISDRAGVSKGYGFVTFETEDEARRPMRDVSGISGFWRYLGTAGQYCELIHDCFLIHRSCFDFAVILFSFRHCVTSAVGIASSGISFITSVSSSLVIPPRKDIGRCLIRTVGSFGNMFVALKYDPYPL